MTPMTSRSSRHAGCWGWWARRLSVQWRSRIDSLRHYAYIAVDGPWWLFGPPGRAAGPRLALDSATTTLRALPMVEPEWHEEFKQGVSVLRSKLDILRTLMNGR
jgi:hypothetical protein